MPKTKLQGFLFGLIMSYAMTYGMELYNIAIKLGIPMQPGGFSNLTYVVFGEALKGALPMGVLVFLCSSLWGNRLGARFAARHCDPGRDNPHFCQLMRQVGTIAFMCPAMSLAASILFNIIPNGIPWFELPAVWVGTILKNFPMAFFWNMFFAAPLTHFLFQVLFPVKRAPGAVTEH